MKIHEYQAKNILKKYGVPVQDGVVLSDVDSARSAVDEVAMSLSTSQFVIKAQVHAGGRGKGGGVKFCKDKESAIEKISSILGMTLVTPQTPPEGCLVRSVMVAEALDIEKEFYVAITLDRSTGRDMVMISTEGGVDIEEVAAHSPEKITKCLVIPGLFLQPFQARRLAFSLGLSGSLFKQMVDILIKLYRCYKESDASIVEINPLIVTKQDKVVALDAKFNFDSNALYRHPDIVSMRDTNEEDPIEVEASKYGVNYIKLDGNVGCMVNGAGLAMATMDIIKLKGGSPANFLDAGGGANVETIKNGFTLILRDPSVKAVLVNIFGGILRCDRVANGIIQAVKELRLEVPVVVRLAGTNADIAKDLLKESGVAIIPAETLDEAADKVVSVVGA